MAPHDRTFAGSLGASGADVVALQSIDHCAAHEAGLDGGYPESESNCWQDKRGKGLGRIGENVGPPARGNPVQVDGEDHEEEEPDPERRDPQGA